MAILYHGLFRPPTTPGIKRFQVIPLRLLIFKTIMKIKPHYVLIRAVSRGIPACWENCPENLSSNFLHHKHFFWGSEQLHILSELYQTLYSTAQHETE